MRSIIHKDALRYPRAKRNPMILKELYQEWWFFEVLDITHDLKFMANCSVNNPADVDSPLQKGCDIASAIILGDFTKSTSKEDSFMDHFEASQKVLDVNIGNTMFFKGIDEKHIKFWGTDPSTGVAFDLVFTSNLPPWKERKTHVGGRFLDLMWYLPAMPSAFVDGTISFEGKDYRVEHGLGYHDHFWGSPTQFRWSPWVTVNDPAFEVITVVVPTKHDFGGACLDRRTWVDLGRPTFQPVSWNKDKAMNFSYPTDFTIRSESRKFKLEMRVKENGSHVCLDGGMENYKCPIIWSWNYVASGTILEKAAGAWKEAKQFEETPASVYYFDNFDFVALANALGIDISDYERFLK